ncbi:MAG: hypothetical protein ACK5YP_18830 [Betaproteobacteria bacterium]
MAPDLLTISEYARRRGCTEGAVRKAIRSGRIMLIDGKVDPVAADAQWRANTRPRITPGARQPGEARATSPEAGVQAYYASRARQAAAYAERA